MESSAAPVASAAAPRYTVDFPHQAPISTKVVGAAAAMSAWPARRAAANKASPSSSGMNPRVPRAVSKRAWTRAESKASLPGELCVIEWWDRRPTGAMRQGRSVRVEPNATFTRSRSTDWATRRGPDGIGWASRNEIASSANSASPQSAGTDSMMRGGAFFGKRSSTASQSSVSLVHTAWLPTGLVRSEPRTTNPFWLRTSVIARSKVRRHRSTSGNPASAPRDRISSWGVDALR